MTAGQTKLTFAGEENNYADFSKRKNSRAGVSKKGNLKIIKANQDELTEHNNYIDHIKSKADGNCVWEQQEEQ